MFAAYSVCVDAVGCDARSHQRFGRLGGDACPKGNNTFLVQRRNTTTFKHCERLGYQQVSFLNMHKHCNADLFKKVVGE